MAEDLKVRYADSDLEEFRTLIEEKIEKAQKHLELLKSSYMNDGNNGTDDTSPTFKAFEEGSETRAWYESFAQKEKQLFFDFLTVFRLFPQELIIDH